MNKQILITLAVTGLAVAGCRTTERTMGFRGSQLEDLPDPAQSAVKQELSDAQILDIDKERRSGRLVYEITYQAQPGLQEKTHVTEDGRILNSKQASMAGWFLREPAGAERHKSSSLDSTSSSVHASNAEARKYGTKADSDFSEQKKYRAPSSSDSQSAAAASSQRSSAQRSAASRDQQFNAEAHVNAATEDSRSAEAKGTSQLRQDQQNAAQRDYSASTTASAAGPRIGTKFEDLPQAVKDAIQEQYSSTDIADIDKEMRNGQAVYEITFKEAGRNPKIFLAEDGSWLSQSEFRERSGAANDQLKAPREGRGAAEALLQKDGPSHFKEGELKAKTEDAIDESAGAEKRDQGPYSTEAAGAQKRTRLDTSAQASASLTPVKMNELPEAVQKTIEEHAGAAKVKSIHRKTSTGYEVHFENESENPKLCISEEGKIVEEKDK